MSPVPTAEGSHPCLVSIFQHSAAMFKKILIANRGEIALRVICACKELGIQTVAVYSEADRNSLHVRFADEAVCIGPPRSSESYLNIPSIISAAEITNVDAVHPGYGYLSESAYFAEVCQSCHLTFIGPTPQAIRLMGDKARARAAMREAGLPILPGSEGILEDAAEAEAVAMKIGFPVIIKASAGGGGRGMRVVRTIEELRASFRTAQLEATNAFGIEDVYIEKYVEHPRHIEFQVLADSHGRVIHLGERECSIQRRHQKVLEESPSPAVDCALRSSMGSRVVKALQTVGYLNAGTMEFLMDESRNFYFMEMNTRIQVEHPVTEFVTGLDLVRKQILIAAGEGIDTVGSDLKLRGHAIECRINAEDPDTFQPCSGKITAWHPPSGTGVRVDTAMYAESEVTPYYDSLIAKVIVHARNREEALRRMTRALDMFIVEGIKTNIPLHQRIICDPDFVSGNIDTRFLERYAGRASRKVA
jgi:acetyl-CoA carboxylase biotin carboxylase subunit